MDGQILMTNYDLDPGGGSANYYHHSNHHPELEHLANTMPKPSSIMAANPTTNHENSDTNINNNRDNNIRSQSRMSISHDKGLLNMPGQNNCFLNSAVQVLWHLDIFRRSFRELHGHACMGDSCIFCALKELFNQFQSSTESALPPDSLRFALAQAFSDQRRFRLGYMDDAAECFENILFRIHYHITNQDLDSTSNCLPHCIPHQKFSMNLYEQIVCYSCGATSDPFLFSQMVHYTSTSALCVQQQMYNNNINSNNNANNDKAKFGELLKKASSMGDIRNCPKMCGARMNIKKILLNRPDIISIGLVWDTDHPSISFIKNVYQIIETQIYLNDIFDIDDGLNNTTNNDCNKSTRKNWKKLDLVGLVTYYGKHYSTYIFNTKLSQWIYFDDATVRVVGQQWQQVVEKCIKGHFQPLLLFYSNPMAMPINTQYASKDIVPMTIIKKSEISHSYSVTPKSPPISPLPPKIPLHQQHLKQDKINSDVNSFQHYQNDNISNSQSLDFNKFGFKQPHPVHSDVPDSPSATSTTSYFSDVGGDSTDGYISRKTVENIIKIQQRTSKQTTSIDSKSMFNNRKYNRNSSSSLESFDSTVRQQQSSNISSKLTFHNSNDDHQQLQQLQQPSSSLKTAICSLQRRDSGNSSGDRASSASSNETPYYPTQKRLLKVSSSTSQRVPSTSSTLLVKNISDQGYDSFSLSSSDSYPSTTTASSPSKLNPRLKQIPEDVQLIDMVNMATTTMDECDKLCSEADILLLKSHEKEREGDLRAAAALSDSAAAKARQAMDIPYSNHQTLISAKMKHSMCVMRSASLHKRVLEIEVEEKRLLKSQEQSHHSRQSSRDSSHGRHSRQGSKDAANNKDVVVAKCQSTKENVFNNTKAAQSKDSISSSKWASPFNLEIYATLPKKSKRNKSPKNTKDVKDSNPQSFKSNEKIYENLNHLTASNNRLSSSTRNHKSKNKSSTKTITSIIPDSDFSDYHSEWEAIKKKRHTTVKLEPTAIQNGWQSCRENDSESGYAEFSPLPKSSSVCNKKQCKVKRKLMFGNFLKTKNRSLPDLREEIILEKSDNQKNNSNGKSLDNELTTTTNNNRSSVANINAKGFYQSHKSFVAEQGFKSKSLLIKVKPPLLLNEENGNNSIKCNNNKRMSNNLMHYPPQQNQHYNQSLPINDSFKDPQKLCKSFTKEDCFDQEKSPPQRNLFLEELNKKRNEILKYNSTKNDSNENNNNLNKNEVYHPIPTTNMGVSTLQSQQPSDTIDGCNSKQPQTPTSLSSQQSKRPQPALNMIPSQQPVPSMIKKPSLFEIANFISKNAVNNNNLNNSNHNNNQILDLTNNNQAATSPPPLTTNVHMPIPVNPSSVINIDGNYIRSSSNRSKTRLQKPPDYETTIKRIEMMNIGVGGQFITPISCSSSSSSSSSGPIYSNMLSFQQSRSLPPQPPTSISSTNNNDNMSINNPTMQSSSSNIGANNPQRQQSNIISTNFVDNSLCNHQQQQIYANNKTNSNVVNNNSNKKSVKFSDHIELVACADPDDEQEEPLPNLLFEKILTGKNLVYTLQQ